MANLKVELVKSLNGRHEKHIATANSMGLRKIGDTSVQPDNDHQSRELGHAAALHGLGNTVEENELFHVFALFAFKSRHCIFLLP